MKKLFNQFKLGALLLLSTLMVSPLTMAVEEVTDKELYEFFNGNKDITRQQMAYALINYEAAKSMNEYLYNQQLLQMPAPGTSWALNAGIVVGGSYSAPGTVDDTSDALKTVSSYSKTLSNTSMMNLVGLFSPSKQVKFPDLPNVAIDVSKIQQNATQGRMALLSTIEPFFTKGDPSALTIVNPGLFMANDNLPNIGVTPEQSQQMINVATNPDPYINLDPALVSKISALAKNPLINIATGGNPFKKLSGDEQEALLSTLMESSGYMFSASALSDIVARRTPAKSQSKTVMEIMNGIPQPFTSPEFYQQVGKASDTALLRQLVIGQAISNFVQVENFKVAERQMALLASLNAVMSKINSSLNNLNKQMQKAAAEATAAAASASESLKGQCGVGDNPPCETTDGTEETE